MLKAFGFLFAALILAGLAYLVMLLSATEQLEPAGSVDSIESIESSVLNSAEAGGNNGKLISQQVHASNDTVEISNQDKETIEALTRNSSTKATSELEETRSGSRSSQLWSLSEDTIAVDDRITGNTVSLEIDQIASLQPNDSLLIAVPGSEGVMTARIKQTFNQLGNVKVWQGALDVESDFTMNGNAYAGHPQDNIVISRGKKSTHITIATRASTYTAVVDNATGQGHIVNEAEYVALQDPHNEDGVTVPFQATIPSAD